VKFSLNLITKLIITFYSHDLVLVRLQLCLLKLIDVTCPSMRDEFQEPSATQLSYTFQRKANARVVHDSNNIISFFVEALASQVD
jgi:hypothetical protein